MVLSALWNKIRQGLAKTRQVFGRLASLFRLRGKVDKEFLAQLEETLYLADVGPAATKQIVERVRQAFLDREISEDVLSFVKQELVNLLNHSDRSLHFNPNGPTVILVAGVNGSGKTTSIAKLAYWLQQQGKKVLLAAADTFRAAAVEQLTVWSQRIGCDIVKGESGSDPGAVAHNACEAALARGADVVIVDTAGRLQTHEHLMRQLEKIRRVLARQIPGAPHEVLLVLDATNGQNAIQQAESFKKAIQCTGIILAKLDGTAKGGAIIPIRQKVGLPVKFVGLGEKLEDLAVFDPQAYVEALFGE
jgi:fused signal recognition particle receptor